MEYSYNDWRYFLEHKEGSKYDWSSGTNPPDYNSDYYEKHKEEILAKRRQKDGGVRDFGGSGVGYKAKKDNTTGENLSDYENDEDWSDELTDDERKNIDAHNAQIDKNIEDLTKSVEDYINANKDKLSPDQINKLRADLKTQVSIANEQRINTKNSDDYNYVMDLRKKSGTSNVKLNTTQTTTKQTIPKKSTSSSPSSSNSKQTSSTKPKKTYEQMKQEEYERMTETKRKEAEEFAKQRDKNKDDFNYDNEEARRRKEEQERIRNKK